MTVTQRVAVAIAAIAVLAWLALAIALLTDSVDSVGGNFLAIGAWGIAVLAALLLVSSARDHLTRRVGVVSIVFWLAAPTLGWFHVDTLA